MAGMSDTPTPNRRTRRTAAATGTAPVQPAIDAAVDRAAIERDPASTGDVPAVDAPVLPADGLPGDPAAVLPEPTLTGEPDRPTPIVTAAPPVTGEPSAIDVAQAEAITDRVTGGIATEADRDRPYPAAAGQPMIAIEGPGAAGQALREAIGDGAVDQIGASTFDILGDRDRRGFGRQPSDDLVVLDFDDLVLNLQLLSDHDPAALFAIGQRFFFGSTITGVTPTTAEPTVTVIEVVGPAQGRRRAGMSFGPKAQRFLASTFNEDDLSALRRDPLLAVSIGQMSLAEAAIAFPDVNF